MHSTKSQLYESILDISTILRDRRMRFLVHFWSAKELGNALLFLMHKHEARQVSRRETININ